MPHFSKRSLANLETCDIRLQTIASYAIEIYDFSVLCGYRGQEAQTQALLENKSTLPWPESKHNKLPSKAMDLAPWPIDWSDINRFYELAGVIKTLAFRTGVKIRWGGDWKTFKDYPHFELVEEG